MLILTRRFGQRVMIGDDIEIVVLRGDAYSGVRLGIKAPKSLPVHRQEIYDKIQREKYEKVDTDNHKYEPRR